MSVITLYHSEMSVCAAKVRIVLSEKNIEWTGVLLNLRGGDAQKPEYLKLNPNAVVPTIARDGRPLIESTVICEYLDDQWPDPSLKPASAWDRAKMRLWTKQLDEGVHAAVGTLSFCIAVRHELLARSAADREKWVAGIPQADRRERSKTNLESGVHSPFFAPAALRCARLFQDFDASLAESNWLAGTEFSLADVGFAPYLVRFRMLGLDLLFERYPRVAEWADRICKRPSVTEGVTKWISEGASALYSNSREEGKEALARVLSRH
ncbi:MULTISPECIES: glutathione S-transferase family protein [Bradyrhizobium]|uniref:glutathione S-transferase family protein n=1 Tax=Bradyrhizobium TaxID=374 RepID=UPI001449C7B4|nr:MULTISPECIES: glutathione S-transferase family protein [Bradyrhizobium]MCP1924701.1 glutathione S-transferase [Bradyrhizobium elkanii]MCS3584539.1 glutathione S-transferase [Bradyrhizobium elkanii]MCS3718119.1 glutathione S-transferase [Bradyrhizobium elkanii]MCS4011827.1 glutathione S-transferase [Bradyrhizobium elkanii USDA 61]QOZ19632.1 glutathione S-transferase family protein [Bradyrhizobium sp. CCBAU 21365]